MISLNLTANGMEQNLIKEFLQNNVNEFLADKINNGVKIVKNNKTLINKKTLDGFMDYAHEEAKKLATKNAKFACLHHDTVFGWAMHYFEEDDIEGTLYNEDGTEYKPIVKKPTPSISTPTTSYTPPVKKPEPQLSLFDMLSTNKNEENNDTEKPASLSYKAQLAIKSQPDPLNDEPTEEDINDAFKELNKEPVNDIKPISPMYKRYLDIQSKHPKHVIAYRLGDFYEVFGDSAVKISQELDLTLTGRDCGLKERIAMVGFPYHIAEKYFIKIIQNNKLFVVDGDNEYEYKPIQNIPSNVDRETGEIVSSETSINNDIIKSLQALFSDFMEIRL